MIGLVGVTAAGQAAADRLAKAWPDARRYDGPAGAALPRAFKECDAIVCFLAVGATVRLLAPLLKGKHEDPGVVCVDEALRFAVPVLGAHQGGGNALARRVAETLGAEPVITTASDAAGTVGARRVRRRPGLPRRAGQRPGRRGRRDPVRRPGDLHRRPASGRCPRSPPTWCAPTAPNQGFPPSW